MASSSVSFRSFTVFVDSEDTEQKPKIKSPMRLARSFSDSSIFTASLPIVTNKENMDPLTGERVTSSNAVGKKRKGSISVLAAKPVLLEKVKDQEAQPEAKKRKSSVSSGSSSKPKAKKTSTSSSVKKTGKRSSRRASPMPKVEEENEAEREQKKEQKKLDQAQIDSKCYDLTVKPLADVSEAYESPEQDGFHIVKEASAEPELRDYFASTSSFSSTLRGSSPAEPKNFSTPERKQIYSAFTFTSPSPSKSKLLTKMRSTSLPPLEFGGVVKTA